MKWRRPDGECHLYSSRPGEGPAILNAYGHLAAATKFRRLTGLYAFASRKGHKTACGLPQESEFELEFCLQEMGHLNGSSAEFVGKNGVG